MLTIFKQFYHFIGPRRKKLKISMLYGVLEALCESTKIIAIYVVLKALLRPEGGTVSTLWTAVIIMVIGIILAIFFKSRSAFLQTQVGYGTAAGKRMEIGDHLKYVPMGFMNKESLGRIISVATGTCGIFQDVATIVIMMVSSGILYAVMITILLFTFDWHLGIISAAAIVAFFLLNHWTQKSTGKIAERKVEADTRLTERILEFVQGMMVVKSFGLVEDKTLETHKSIEESKNAAIEAEMKLIPRLFIQGFVLKLFSAGLLLTTIYLYLQGQILIYECLTMVIASFAMLIKLESAGAYASVMKILQHSMNRIEKLFEIPTMDIGGEDVNPASLDMEFQNVSFAYEQREVLHHINLKIPQGTVTAIIGPSGGGKTTLTQLLPRFWDVSSGVITLGDKNVKEYTLDSLWKNFTAVFQDVYLFDDTLENNMKFGKPEATREEVLEVAKKAGCMEFIEKLPEGLDTMVGEGGSRLSGGEAQRVSIARAMLKDAPIVLLDEATANIDPENEKLIQKAIAELTKGKTVIMIAHRLKTVVGADQIVVLKDGCIENIGTHKELIEQPGTYRDFIAMREKAMTWQVK